jgi:hypothetical protein
MQSHTRIIKVLVSLWFRRSYMHVLQSDTNVGTGTLVLQGRFAMLKALMVAVLSAAFIVTADAKSEKQTGTIIKVDDAAKTFICQWGRKDITYKTTDKTVVRAGGKDGTLSDLKEGARVTILYHTVDKDRVADRVTVEKR